MISKDPTPASLKTFVVAIVLTKATPTGTDIHHTLAYCQAASKEEAIGEFVEHALRDRSGYGVISVLAREVGELEASE